MKIPLPTILKALTNTKVQGIINLLTKFFLDDLSQFVKNGNLKHNNVVPLTKFNF